MPASTPILNFAVLFIPVSGNEEKGRFSRCAGRGAFTPREPSVMNLPTSVMGGGTPNGGRVCPLDGKPAPCNGGVPTRRAHTFPVAARIDHGLKSRYSYDGIMSTHRGAPMDAIQPGGPQVRLLDLIDAMRKLRSAAGAGRPDAGVVADARGAALAILTPAGTFVSVNRSAAALLGYS